jgi:hypothetical protein
MGMDIEVHLLQVWKMATHTHTWLLTRSHTHIQSMDIAVTVQPSNLILCAQSRDEVITQRQLRRYVAATTKRSKKAPVLTERVTRRRAQVNYSELIHNALASTTIDGDPRSYEEVMLSPLKQQWQAAIMEQSNSMIQNETFSRVNLQ